MKKKGFAHVEFKENDSAKSAMKLHNQPFDGRELRIDLADPSNKN